MTSYTAAGWAAMLLGVSSVDAFSSLGRRPDGVRTNLLSPGSQNAGFVARRRSSTEFYGTHNGNSDQDRDASQVVAASRWWQAVVQPAPSPALTPADEQQQAVDEYLEFLDKRYKRLHESEKKEERASTKFSALKWLMGDETDPVSQRQQENALYVLGVAELASERLLQKHQAAPQQHKRHAPVQEKESEVVIDAVVEDISQDVVAKYESPPETRQALLLATVSQMVRSVLTGVGNRRKALIAYQDKKLMSAMTRALNTIARTPFKAIQAFWKLGGGKKTVALTASAFITAFLVFRPVVQAMMEGALSR